MKMNDATDERCHLPGTQDASNSRMPASSIVHPGWIDRAVAMPDAGEYGLGSLKKQTQNDRRIPYEFLY
jgi:hypothetical protein